MACLQVLNLRNETCIPRFLQKWEQKSNREAVGMIRFEAG